MWLETRDSGRFCKKLSCKNGNGEDAGLLSNRVVSKVKWSLLNHCCHHHYIPLEFSLSIVELKAWLSVVTSSNFNRWHLPDRYVKVWDTAALNQLNTSAY